MSPMQSHSEQQQEFSMNSLLEAGSATRETCYALGKVLNQNSNLFILCHSFLVFVEHLLHPRPWEGDDEQVNIPAKS